MSSYRKKVEEIFSVHEHYWQPSVDPVAQRCSCGKWQISAQERDRRIDEWKKYYEDIKERQPYKDWIEMSKAFREKNKPEIVKINNRIAERCIRVGFEGEEMNWQFTEDSYLKVPNTPNPDGYPYIISY